MNRTKVVTATALSLVTLTWGSTLATAEASPSAPSTQTASTPTAVAHAKANRQADRVTHSDYRKTKLQRKYSALRQKALQQTLRGKAKTVGNAKKGVVKLGKGQFAKINQTGKDRIFVILVQFGKTAHPSYPDGDSDATTFDGPLHNQIPKPNRKRDNTTLWKKNYNRAHFDDMFFNRMDRYYRSQSAGTYSIDGDVTSWVKVPFNEARYGRDDCGDLICSNTWFLIRDGLAYWVQNQLDAGQTMDQINAYLNTFDRRDRYDFDQDGDFMEPDGYLDHLQVVHAGGDQAAGDPIYNSDAIWSHSWAAAIQDPGTGPTDLAQIGGVNIGEGGPSGGGIVNVPDNPTDVWAYDYTVQPENGGLGVFAHEYGHDLDLPDLYDTSGNTGGAENSTGFWTLMSSGANSGDGGTQGTGDAPPDMGTWEKFQLGWLDYDVARAGRSSRHVVGPSALKTKNPDAVFVLLPDKHVTRVVGPPCPTCGTAYYYSDMGDDLNNTMTRDVAAGGALTAKVLYDMEEFYDYAFVEASNDDGDTWTPIETNLSSPAEDDQSGFNTSGAGITGSTNDSWVDLTATVPADTNALRFRYQTDPAFTETGFRVDNIAIDGTDLGTAETGPEGWTFDGFRRTTGSDDVAYFNAYIAENRQYVANDKSLRTNYNYGFLDKKPDWVEFFPYQNGMLVNYWDTSEFNNNVGDHPGSGLILPVDANPFFSHWKDGTLMRPRIQTYDSTFGLERSQRITLHFNSVAATAPGHPAVRTFNDNLDYWYARDEHSSAGDHPGHYQPGWNGVDVPKTGTKIRVVKVSKNGTFTLAVNP